jgi:hypothetical protein
MKTTLRYLPGFLVAAMALALSASLAFAGQPATSAGLTKAATHTGKAVPVRAHGDGATADLDATEEATETETETDEDTEEEAPSEPADEAANCSTDPTALGGEELLALTHGSIVCWAAQQVTPDGYANHGAWVKTWAQLKLDENGVAIPKAHGKGAAHH